MNTVMVMNMAMMLSSGSTPSFAITPDQLQPLIDGVTSNIGVILPIGLAIFAVMIGIRLIPKLIAMFTRG